MINLVKRALSDSTDDLLFNWNQSTPKPYKLTNRLINEKLIKSVFTIHEGSYSLYHENDYIGSIVLKHQKDIGLDNSVMHISLIFIAQQFRHLGYGTMLLENSKKTAHDLGFSKIIIGGDMDCLFSGVFVVDNINTNDFFIKNGWSIYSKNYNLIATKPNESIYELPEDLRLVSKLNQSDYDKLTDFVGKNFSPRWLYETLHTNPNYFFILKQNEKIIGFVRWGDELSTSLPNSVNQYSSYSKLAGIGPLGIDSNFRGHGVGLAFISNVLKELWKMKYHNISVDWTNLVHFYQKCGFHEICSEFIQYQYSLRG